MKILLIVSLLFSLSSFAIGEENKNLDQKVEIISAEALDVDPKRFEKFIKKNSGSQLAVVSTIGMVCDFCARGIAKTFKKDSRVKTIDVDLRKGKVLIAYSLEATVDFEDIKKKIQSNGQNAVALKVVTI